MKFFLISDNTDTQMGMRLAGIEGRSLAFDTDLLETYSQITLIAWSMGVWAASQIMKQYPHLPVSQSIAINGTLYPIQG